MRHRWIHVAPTLACCVALAVVAAAAPACNSGFQQQLNLDKTAASFAVCIFAAVVFCFCVCTYVRVWVWVCSRVWVCPRVCECVRQRAHARCVQEITAPASLPSGDVARTISFWFYLNSNTFPSSSAQ